MKKVGYIFLLIFILLLIFAINVLRTTGAFRKVEVYEFNGEKFRTVNLPGAEDMEISYMDSFIIVSSTKRGVYPPKEQEHGGLYLIDLKNDFKVVPLTEKVTFDFAPHGIDIFKTDSSYLVYAINHTLKGHSIEVFSLIEKKLTHQKTITNEEALISPNDIEVISKNQYYFTNDHGYTEGLGKLLEEYAGLAASNVMYFNGSEFEEVAKKIAYANGIAFDTKRNLLFVASPRNFLIKVYKKKADGQLSFIENIPCGTGVDNLTIDNDGFLWTGAHPDLLHFAAYAKGKKEFSPSEILKINYKAKGDYEVNTVYVGQGHNMSASTVAIPFGDYIFTGNVKDDHFLILKSNPEN